MTKEERINEFAAVLDSYREELVEEKPVSVTNARGDAVGCYYIKEANINRIGELLTDAGFGNLREYRAKIIDLYLKGRLDELLKFMMEEI